MEGRFAGKNVLVTGAGAGIGRAVAIRFAREGARVGINYYRNQQGAREALEEIRDIGSDGLLLPADVSDQNQVEHMVAVMIDAWDSLHVLINNSGIGSRSSPDRVHEITGEDWDRVMAVNLKGCMLTSRSVLPYFIDQGSGSIVNISSIRGLLGNPVLAAYCASKGGEVVLTRQMALDYARYGVRVNCVCPGFVDTEMFRGYLNKQDDPAAARAEFARMAPLNRVGRPEEIASVCAFLASDASSFITGAALAVDGGYTANGVREIR